MPVLHRLAHQQRERRRIGRARTRRTHREPQRVLDNVDNEAAVETQLREAVKDALATGSAIAIGHPRPATLAAVRSLGPTFASEGVDLTLASSLVH